jgi:hypothetical protein
MTGKDDLPRAREERPGSKRKFLNRSYAFTPADVALVDFITEFTSMSKSDAVRTAIRAYAFHLETVNRSARK